jgi:hypothetical protein
MEKIKYFYYYPENIELKKHLRKGDITLISRACKKSPTLIQKIFLGERKMKPEVRRVYDLVVRFNAELADVLGLDKKPNV